VLNVQVLPSEIHVFVVHILREFGFYVLRVVRTGDEIIYSYETNEYGGCS
jgi:hypothetical protein